MIRSRGSGRCCRTVASCHIKDATRTKTPGTWGDEVVVGTGDVDWRAFFATLGPGFSGTLALEREAGSERVADLKSAYAFVRRAMEAP